MTTKNFKTNNEYLQFLILRAKFDSFAGSHIVTDMLVDGLIEKDSEVTRNMCAKVHPSLIESLDRVTAYLNVSKRRFIEHAVSSAVAEAEEAISLLESEISPEEL